MSILKIVDTLRVSNAWKLIFNYLLLRASLFCLSKFNILALFLLIFLDLIPLSFCTLFSTTEHPKIWPHLKNCGYSGINQSQSRLEKNRVSNASGLTKKCLSVRTVLNKCWWCRRFALIPMMSSYLYEALKIKYLFRET